MFWIEQAFRRYMGYRCLKTIVKITGRKGPNEEGKK
jgi:hypothetical protein